MMASVQPPALMWSYLIHLGVNMWSDRIEPLPGRKPSVGVTHRATELVCDSEVWNRVIAELVQAGFTHVVIDLAEAVRYRCHPELAVANAWTTEDLVKELASIRSLGLTPLPKLNFSTAHDAWLGEYGRQVSTPLYYEVCRNLIAEVIGLFDGPEFFHLGMDEETDNHQKRYDYAVVRRRELWWSDLEFLCDQVRAGGVRPWVWSDPAWHHPVEFYEQMPRDVLQSNWYYGLWFESDEAGRPRVLDVPEERHLTYLDLEDHGYDQVPTGSSWRNRWDNFDMTVQYCADRIAPERLKGFLQAPWVMTTEDDLDIHLRTIDRAAETIAAWRGR